MTTTTPMRPGRSDRRLSMIAVRRPSARNGHRWQISVIAEEENLTMRTVETEIFERDDSHRAAEFVRALGSRFPSAYVAEY